MLVCQQALPAYNIQTAVDTENALIVAHAVVLDASDIRCLRPMAEAAKQAIGADSFNVVADAGYSNGEQVTHCEGAGMMPFVPVTHYPPITRSPLRGLGDRGRVSTPPADS